MDIKLKANDPWAGIPQRATPGSFGYDLQTIKVETIGPRQTVIVNTALILAEDLPINSSVSNVPMGDGVKYLGAQEGMAAFILPRSSLALKRGLIVPNSPGLIDADYTKEIGVLLHNLTDAPVQLEQGERIAQLVFVSVYLPAIREVSVVAPERRPRGGFGSTGT